MKQVQVELKNIKIHRHRSPQSGVVMVFVAFCLVVLISLLALVLDAGRLFILTKQIQNAADAAALGGIEALDRTYENCDNTVPVGGWVQVKPIVRFILKHFDFTGVRNIKEEDKFNEASSVFTGSKDLPDFNYTELWTLPGTGQLKVKIERGIVCYQGGTKRWFSLDNPSQEDKYCMANAVDATVTVETIPYIFARLLGATSKAALTRTARTNIRNLPPNNCGEPDCSRYFVDGDPDAGVFAIGCGGAPKPDSCECAEAKPPPAYCPPPTACPP